jgi:alkylation response protein AidB-like acyl-CoA dehydrogenase
MTPDERQERIAMVRDSAEGVLRDDLARARRLRFGTKGYESEKLEEFAVLGWIAMLLPENRGGLGLGMSELAAIACELGRRLTPEPVWQMAVAASVLAEDALLAGSAVVLPAFASPGAAIPKLSGDRLTGVVELLPLGGSASAFVVESDAGLVLVSASAEGVTCLVRESHDGAHLARLTFSDVPARRLEGDAWLLREWATLALSAYSLGLSEAAFEITRIYLTDRRQFDKPIGSFQVLQHKMVDLFLELSLARAAVEQAAETCDDRGNDRQEIRRQVSLARIQSGKAADLVTRAAIQLHGGIGYTDEADIGLYLRKNMVLSGLMGSTAFHQARAFELLENQQ